jgi:hypothetical protein
MYYSEPNTRSLTRSPQVTRARAILVTRLASYRLCNGEGNNDRQRQKLKKKKTEIKEKKKNAGAEE